MCVDLRACSGVLIVDKPDGMSSGYACRKVQRHFGLKNLEALTPLPEIDPKQNLDILKKQKSEINV